MDKSRVRRRTLAKPEAKVPAASASRRPAAKLRRHLCDCSTNRSTGDLTYANGDELVPPFTRRSNEVLLECTKGRAAVEQLRNTHDEHTPAAAPIGIDVIDLEGDDSPVTAVGEHPVGFGPEDDSAAGEHVVDRDDRRQRVMGECDASNRLGSEALQAVCTAELRDRARHGDNGARWQAAQARGEGPAATTSSRAAAR